MELIAPETIDLNFTNRETSIREISKHVDVNCLIAMGAASLAEIKHHESTTILSIGMLRKILDIGINVDLENLETREILLEIIRG